MSIHYAVLSVIEYEGSQVEGIFDTREEAVAYAAGKGDKYVRFEVGAWDGAQKIVLESTSGFPLRGSVPPGAHVHWVGPHIPPFGGGYAIEGVDTWEIRP